MHCNKIYIETFDEHFNPKRNKCTEDHPCFECRRAMRDELFKEMEKNLNKKFEEALDENN